MSTRGGVATNTGRARGNRQRRQRRPTHQVFALEAVDAHPELPESPAPEGAHSARALHTRADDGQHPPASKSPQPPPGSEPALPTHRRTGRKGETSLDRAIGAIPTPTASDHYSPSSSTRAPPRRPSRLHAHTGPQTRVAAREQAAECSIPLGLALRAARLVPRRPQQPTLPLPLAGEAVNEQKRRRVRAPGVVDDVTQAAAASYRSIE